MLAKLMLAIAISTRRLNTASYVTLVGSSPSWIRIFSTRRFCAAYSRARLSIAGRSILALPIRPSPHFAGAGPDRDRTTRKMCRRNGSRWIPPGHCVFRSGPPLAREQAGQRLWAAFGEDGGTAGRVHQTDIQSETVRHSSTLHAPHEAQASIRTGCGRSDNSHSARPAGTAGLRSPPRQPLESADG